jgi:hypothetical protein
VTAIRAEIRPTPTERVRERLVDTPQMSRQGAGARRAPVTTPSHSTMISACDATTFEATACHGFAASPVSAMTAAAVSSHDVSMASRFIDRSVCPRLTLRHKDHNEHEVQKD